MERLQTFVVGTGNYRDTFESRLLEEELDIQIALLKEQNSITDVTVSAANGIDDECVPNQDRKTRGFLHKPTMSEIAVFEETVLEENLLEPIAICCAIIGLALVPNIMKAI
jgi:hypothetical protein